VWRVRSAVLKIKAAGAPAVLRRFGRGLRLLCRVNRGGAAAALSAGCGSAA